MTSGTDSMTSATVSHRTSPEQSADTSPADAAVFINPTRYVWLYFRIPNLRDEGPTLVELQRQFNDVLSSFQQQTGTQPSATVELPTGTSSVSRRILLLPRRPWGQLNVELEIRQMQDVYVLLINVEAPGKFSIADLPPLTELRFGADEVSNYLGSLTLIQSETNSVSVADAAVALHSHYLKSAGSAVAVIDTGCGALLPGPLANDPIYDSAAFGAAFAYPEQHDTDRVAHSDGSFLSAAEEQLMVHLPSIGLCHLKAANSARRLRTDLSPAVQSGDHNLQQLLAGRLPEAASASSAEKKELQQINRRLHGGQLTQLKLDQLRYVSDLLTTLRSGLTDASEETRREIHTVDVNRSNLIATVRTWSAGGTRLQDVVYDSVVNDAVLQAESDRDYASSTLKRADIFFESIEASARCHEVQETRWVAHVMIGLGALAAADLVPPLMGSRFESLEWGWRLAIEAGVFAGVAAVATLILCRARGQSSR